MLSYSRLGYIRKVRLGVIPTEYVSQKPNLKGFAYYVSYVKTG